MRQKRSSSFHYGSVCNSRIAVLVLGSASAFEVTSFLYHNFCVFIFSGFALQRNFRRGSRDDRYTCWLFCCVPACLPACVCFGGWLESTRAQAINSPVEERMVRKCDRDTSLIALSAAIHSSTACRSGRTMVRSRCLRDGWHWCVSSQLPNVRSHPEPQQWSQTV